MILRNSLRVRCLSSSSQQIVPHFSPSNLISDRNRFSEIIDVRTPLEYEDDRIHPAVNIPVLSNEERVKVGTLYNQKKFEARKLGASLISRNIGDHLTDHFADKEKHYKPLIYCWRGGQRSRSLAIILQEIGFQPSVVEGGYKAYRKMVRDTLFDETKTSLMNKFTFIRISGPTGSGKSLLLEVLKERGEQILHLEQLARHKGSVLGLYPGEKQPSQKHFETNLYEQLMTSFDPSKVIWIENESSKIGDIIVPVGLWRTMCRSERIQVNVSLEDRIDFILQDYDYMCQEASTEYLLQILDSIERYAGRKKIQSWKNLVIEKRFRELVSELIVGYYDLNYKKPNREPSESFDIPEGWLVKKNDLIHSSVVNEIISFGNKIMSNEQEQIMLTHC